MLKQPLLCAVRILRRYVIVSSVAVAFSQSAILAQAPTKEQVKQVNEYLVDYEANSARLENYIFGCEGWLTDVKGEVVGETRDLPFSFVGIVDQDNGRCRWICRSSVNSVVKGVTSSSDVEYEYLLSAERPRAWANGVDMLPEAPKPGMRGRVRLPGNSSIRFHPIPLAIVGFGGVSSNDFRGRNIVFQQRKDENLISVRSTKVGLVASWKSTSTRGSYSVKEVVFSHDAHHMPIQSRTHYLRAGQGTTSDSTLLTETTSEWKPLGSVWVPSKMTHLRYYGGGAKPHRLIELACQFDWEAKIKNTASYFELDSDDAGRPSWTPKLQELLGPPHRLPAEMVPLASGVPSR
jgi:hypothetical protein